jgi:toxin HigB-1
MAIKSFADEAAENFFYDGKVAKGVGWSNTKDVVKRKLDLIQNAVQLGDLKAPPGNRLEKLEGDLTGFHSIRVNDQWRIIFKWDDSGVTNVKVTDYH